jgi:tRNA(Ile)-lysidine synthase
MMPGADEARRFAAGLDAQIEHDVPIGVAVSGGPDCLALLLLTVQARPGMVQAATVDHGLRPDSAAEAAMVADLCARLAVPHAILAAAWEKPPISAIQAQAREARYELLGRWARDRGLVAVLTAHHADDQAETLLMRLDRGAGIGGLAGARASRLLGPDSTVSLVRPLLSWRRDELARIVEHAGLEPVDDPSNRDPRHERTRARDLLRSQGWPDALAVAASASHLADAEDALEFGASTLFAERVRIDGGSANFDSSGLPREYRRRVMLKLFAALGESPPRGPDLERAMTALSAGKRCTLGGLMLTGGPVWRADPVPPRRT